MSAYSSICAVLDSFPVLLVMHAKLHIRCGELGQAKLHASLFRNCAKEVLVNPECLPFVIMQCAMLLSRCMHASAHELRASLQVKIRESMKGKAGEEEEPVLLALPPKGTPSKQVMARMRTRVRSLPGIPAGLRMLPAGTCAHIT